MIEAILLGALGGILFTVIWKLIGYLMKCYHKHRFMKIVRKAVDSIDNDAND